MEIYLSSETEGRADSLLLPIRNMVDSLLDDIRKNEYGSALTSVGVFAIIMKEEMYDSGGYCEPPDRWLQSPQRWLSAR